MKAEIHLIEDDSGGYSVEMKGSNRDLLGMLHEAINTVEYKQITKLINSDKQKPIQEKTK